MAQSAKDLADARKAALDKIEARRKRYGGGSAGRSIHYGNDQPSIQRISTGSPMLDYATNGGMPRGRWIRMYGGKSSGKSLTIWNTIRNAMAQGLTCCYCNVEKQYDVDFTKSCGVDVKKLLVLEGTIVEEIATDILDLMEVVDCFFIDSCSEAISQAEAAGEPGDQFMASKVRAWNQAFTLIQKEFDETRHMIVYTDHIRDKFGGGVAPPGGRLMEHRSSLTLYFQQGAWLFRNKQGRLVAVAEPGMSVSGNTEADGIETKVRVEKSRVGRPFRSARMHYDLDNARLDTAWELVQLGCALDYEGNFAKRSGKDPIILQSGAWYTPPVGKKVQGENALAMEIDRSPELRKHLEEAIANSYERYAETA